MEAVVTLGGKLFHFGLCTGTVGTGEAGEERVVVMDVDVNILSVGNTQECGVLGRDQRLHVLGNLGSSEELEVVLVQSESRVERHNLRGYQRVGEDAFLQNQLEHQVHLAVQALVDRFGTRTEPVQSRVLTRSGEHLLDVVPPAALRLIHWKQSETVVAADSAVVQEQAHHVGVAYWFGLVWFGLVRCGVRQKYKHAICLVLVYGVLHC